MNPEIDVSCKEKLKKKLSAMMKCGGCLQLILLVTAFHVTRLHP